MAQPASQKKQNMTYIVLVNKNKRKRAKKNDSGELIGYTLHDWCKMADRNYNTVIGRIHRADINNKSSVIFLREDSEMLGEANRNTLLPLTGEFHDRANVNLKDSEFSRISKKQKPDGR